MSAVIVGKIWLGSPGGPLQYLACLLNYAKGGRLVEMVVVVVGLADWVVLVGSEVRELVHGMA